MFQNYFKIAIRNLFKHKVYSIVNLSGLVIGLTCSMLVIIYILHEYNFDRFHENADHIFRLGREVKTSDNEIREPLSSAPSARVLLQNFPEIADVVRFTNIGKIIVRYGDIKFYEKNISYTDPSVFDVFTFPMISGDSKTALVEPYSVVLTENTAKKYFGATNPLGKTLRFNNRYDYVVTGIMENVPDNSHFEFDMLCSMETLYAQQHPDLNDWFSFNYSTYVLLNNNANYIQLEQKFPAFVNKYIGSELKKHEKSIKFFLHPLTKIRLYSHLEGYPPGRIVQVYFFIVFALSILIIACINFINLCTARATMRSKEIGVRKVIGASRSHLIGQFIGEAIILSIISFIIALIFVELILPEFSIIIHQQLTINYFDTPLLLLCFFALTVLVGLGAGSYPAFYLSRFRPIMIFKGSLFSGVKKMHFKSILVVLQFFISTVFIIQTLIFKIQFDNLLHIDLGFHKKDVIVLPIIDDEIRQSIKLMKKELTNNPGVVSVAAASQLPGYYIPRNLKRPQGFTEDQMQLMDEINVDHDFIPTLDIAMAAGRNFTETISTDETDAILINETAVKQFGWDNPLGKTIQYSDGPDKLITVTICGVIKDFHLATPHRVIAPLFISNHANDLHHLLIRIRPAETQRTIDYIRNTWNRLYPNYPFEYSFLEQSYDRYFQVVNRVLQAFYYFIFLAIFIACLGIFALTTHITEHQTKEIGIRKVAGATTFDIILLLNRHVLKLVMIAIVFAWIFMYISFLDPTMFLAYFVDVSFLIYIEAALIVLFIALITISYQSVKTAMSNPVESLRYE